MDRYIHNRDALATSALRADALAIAEAAYGAVDVRKAVARKVVLAGDSLSIDGAVHDLAGRQVFFVGVGKCSFAAAEAVELVLGERLTGGIALGASPASPHRSAKIEAILGTHPLPSEMNVRATRRVLDFLADRTERDLVLMFISGGGSTLLCSPKAPMSCLDERMLFEELTARGATIQEINTVRKHLSLARGGGLAKAAYPAEVISLIVSDVPGNDIGFIASGPTVRDASTIDEAAGVLTRYGVTCIGHIAFLETPKEEKYFARVTNTLFLTNRDALDAMAVEATKRGYATTIADSRFSGEARDVGREVAKKLRAAPANTALLCAGESTVTLSGNVGAGGRNQEMALAALADIRDDELLLPFASDGQDNTDHAGGIADSLTRAHAREQNLASEDYLHDHRSYDFFKAAGDALQTGYTDSNVSDLIIALKQ